MIENDHPTGVVVFDIFVNFYREVLYSKIYGSIIVVVNETMNREVYGYE